MISTNCKDWNLIALYLVTSYAYYELDEPLLEDFEYDELCKYLLDNLDSLSDHPHKHLIDKKLLSAGSGYSINYPSRVVSLATILQQKGGKLLWQKRKLKNPVKVVKNASDELSLDFLLS